MGRAEARAVEQAGPFVPHRGQALAGASPTSSPQPPRVFRAPPAALGLGVEEGCRAVKGLQLGPLVVLPWGLGRESVTWNSSCGSYPGRPGGVQQVVSLSFVGVVTVSQPEAWEGAVGVTLAVLCRWRFSVRPCAVGLCSVRRTVLCGFGCLSACSREGVLPVARGVTVIDGLPGVL